MVANFLNPCLNRLLNQFWKSPELPPASSDQCLVTDVAQRTLAIQEPAHKVASYLNDSEVSVFQLVSKNSNEATKQKLFYIDRAKQRGSLSEKPLLNTPFIPIIGRLERSNEIIVGDYYGKYLSAKLNNNLPEGLTFFRGLGTDIKSRIRIINLENKTAENITEAELEEIITQCPQIEEFYIEGNNSLRCFLEHLPSTLKTLALTNMLAISEADLLEAFNKFKTLEELSLYNTTSRYSNETLDNLPASIITLLFLNDLDDLDDDLYIGFLSRLNNLKELSSSSKFIDEIDKKSELKLKRID